MAAVVGVTPRSAAICGITGSMARTDNADAKIRKQTTLMGRLMTHQLRRCRRLGYASPQQPGADNTHPKHDQRAREQCRSRSAVRKTKTINDGTDRLTEVKRRRMQRGRGPACGVRQ